MRWVYRLLSAMTILRAASRGPRPLITHAVRRQLLKTFANVILRRIR